MVQKNRNIGVELLRIILMLFIVEGHLLTHTGIREQVSFMSVDWIIVWGIQSITVCAVNGFVLISGYYQRSCNLKLEKVLQLWGQVFFYSILLYIISFLWGGTHGVGDTIRAFLPITCKQYWFFTIYVYLFILSPFINVGLERLTKKQFKVLVCVLVLFTVIKPTIFPFVEQYDLTEGFGIVSFITIFVIGAYLRKFVPDIKYKYLILVISMVITFGSKIVLEAVVHKLGLEVGTGIFYHYNTVFQIINCIMMLYIFKDIHIRENTVIAKSILFFSTSTFGVYLIHEHPAVRDLLWKRLITDDFLSAIGSASFIIILIVVPMIIFIICNGLDHLRKIIRVPFIENKTLQIIEKIQLVISR